MTIGQFKHIKSIGRFRDSAARGDVTLKKYNLIFGENARGKTTLCAILRSLQLQDSSIIAGRKTLGSVDAPNVVVAMGGGGSALFKNGAWTGVQPQLRIFDAHYVAENIYAGDVVGPDQRRNLCRVILGTEGVKLAKQYDEIEQRINTLNSSIREARGVLSSHAGGMKLDEFLALAADPAVDAKIEEKARQVEGLKEIDRLRLQAGLSTLQPPPLPTQLEAMLAKTIEDVSKDAGQTVRAHLAAHGMAEDGEDWITKGLGHTEGDSCPFCGQGLEGIDLVVAFRGFFSEAYQDFRHELQRHRENAERLFGEDRIELLVSAVSRNAAAAEIWMRYVRFAWPNLSSAGELRAVLPPAAAAYEQPGKQEDMAACSIDALCAGFAYTGRGGSEDVCELGLARLGGSPEFVIDDVQLRHFGPDPFRFRVAARDAPARARVFDEALAVPDQEADVELIVDDAVAAAGVSADLWCRPRHCRTDRARLRG